MRKIKKEFLNQIKDLKSEVEEFDFPVDLTVHTKAPGKWLLIDMETGQRYIGLDKPNQYGKWLRIDNNAIE
jgi:hypothetical protein